MNTEGTSHLSGGGQETCSGVLKATVLSRMTSHLLRGSQGKGEFGWACPANLDTVTVILLFDILGLVYSFSMK